MTPDKRSTLLSSLYVFLGVAALLAVLHGNRFVLTNDEGILLEAAQRMLSGARLYVDFFGYLSPGSFWIQTALFHLLGVSLWVGRLPVLFDLSMQCALLFWLTARLASRRAAAAAVLIFLGFEIADPSFLTAQHRWDSGTLALAGLCVAIGRPTRSGLAASGALLAAAAWCTPSVALVAVAVAVWLLLAPERRQHFLPFSAGLLAVTAAAASCLALQGTLFAFFRQLLWIQHNYVAVNVMPYGDVIGGYGPLLEGPPGVEAILRWILVGCLALPAILPPLATATWGFAYWRKRIPHELRSSLLLLVLAMGAFIAGAFPRADLMHLQFVVALPYALAAAAIAHLLSVRASAILAFTMIPLAALFALNDLSGWWSARPLATPVGNIRVAGGIATDVEKLLSQVRPGSTLFVYPYMPVHYFITQARNPTRFSYLGPGMMTHQEEAEALGQLDGNPPEWVLYMLLSREEFLRVFPHATALSERFDALQGWLEQNYRPVEETPVTVGGYRLWKRMPQADSSTPAMVFSGHDHPATASLRTGRGGDSGR